MQYKNDDTLESIIQSAERQLDGKKVRCIAFVGHGSPGKLVVCHDQVSPSNDLIVTCTISCSNDTSDYFDAIFCIRQSDNRTQNFKYDSDT